MRQQSTIIIEAGIGNEHHADRFHNRWPGVVWALQPNFFFGTWRFVQDGDFERVEACTDGSCSIIGNRYWSALNEATGKVESWRTWYLDHVRPMIARAQTLRGSGRSVILHCGGWFINDHLPDEQIRQRAIALKLDLRAANLVLDGVLLDYEMEKSAGQVMARFKPVAEQAVWAANFNFSSAQRPTDPQGKRMWWDGGRGRAKGSRFWRTALQTYDGLWEPERHEEMYRVQQQLGEPFIPWGPVVHDSLDWDKPISDDRAIQATLEHFTMAHRYGARQFIIAAYKFQGLDTTLAKALDVIAPAIAKLDNP